MDRAPALSLLSIPLALMLAACPASKSSSKPQSPADEALVAASVKKDLEGVKKALKDGANPNLKADLLAKGPPLVSLARLDKEYAEALIAEGADVNLAREDGDTALITAAIVDNQPVVKLLLEKGADVNAQNKLGYTAVSEAVHKGHLELVTLLVDKGADLGLGGREGEHLPFDRALGKATRARDVPAERVGLVKLIIEKQKPGQKRLDEAAGAAAAWKKAGPHICAIERALVEAGAEETDAVKAFLAKCPAAPEGGAVQKGADAPADAPAGEQAAQE